MHRRLEIAVYQPPSPSFSEYIERVDDNTYCLLVPLWFRITNHNRDNIERIRLITLRIKRKSKLFSRTIHEIPVFDEQWSSVADIRIQPLDDFIGQRCAYGEMNASVLYYVMRDKNIAPPQVDIVLHLVGGAVRKYSHPIPWQWVWVPDTEPLRRIKGIGEFQNQDNDNDT